MTEPVTPQFLPWLRTGLASYITDKAVKGMAPGDTTSVSVAVTLTASGDQEFREAVPAPAIQLRGPGEVLGLDPSLILRRDPEPGTIDAESTYLAQVEFSAPDLPWRYTPSAASGDKLQPWVVLVVVEEREGTWLEVNNDGRLPVLHLDDAAGELPVLEQSWAWAHIQADHDLQGGVAEALAVSPEAFRSRLLCPRRLAPNRPWLACVVPAFEAGRRAGLGEPVSTDMGPAWGGTTTALSLPVYHYWRFRTGPGGDFESLARRLQARELPASVGRRDLDISSPGGGLPAIRKSVISYQGALVSPAGRPRPWPEEPRRRMKDALRMTLNTKLVQKPTPETYDALRDDPVVGPPAYAALQAQQHRTVPAEGEPPLWFGELNTEPQHRTVAGLGTEVIRHDQEALMARAWEFAAGVTQSRRVLNRARAAWEVARRGRQRFDLLPDEMFLQIAGPAMARLPHSAGLTVKGAVTGSALPGGLLSGAFRRLTHAVPGFLSSEAGAMVPLTAAITRTALDDPEEFVGRWATVSSPVNADVEELQAAASLRRIDPDPHIPPVQPVRVQIVIKPYTGDTTHLPSLADQTRLALDPTGTIKAMVEARIRGLPPERDRDVPARLFVSPRFTTPMYRRLVALSVEYLVPGVGDIPDDTLGLLETNPPFVEAFLAGLNHEMRREFVWREYPARPDGTWFQYFWEGGQGASPAALPIRLWKDRAQLGGNAPKDAPQASLVLLIRSALLRRYPDLRVYAVEAAWAQKQKDTQKLYVRREADGGQVKTPLFAARLTPDIAVFGFELEEEVARGSTDPDAHPGYFFVLEQPPGSTRFGLDAARPKGAGKAPAAWTNLSWSHLVEEGAPLPAFIDVNGPSWLVSAGALPSNSDSRGAAGKDSWGEDSAAMARITFQRPVRMLVHADSMLPAADTPKKEKPPKKERL
jgi:hypothetical protein